MGSLASLIGSTHTNVRTREMNFWVLRCNQSVDQSQKKYRLEVSEGWVSTFSQKTWYLSNGETLTVPVHAIVIMTIKPSRMHGGDSFLVD